MSTVGETSRPAEDPASDFTARGDVRKHVLQWQLALLGTGPFIGAVTSPRFFSTIYSAEASHAALTGVSRALAIGVTQGALALGLLGLFTVLPCLRLDRRARPLFVTGTLFYLVACVVAAVNDRSSMLPPLTLLLFFGLLFLLPRSDPEWLKQRFRTILRCYAGGSLISASLSPNWALESFPDSVLPGIGVRLHGLAPHANVLAAMMLVLLILEMTSVSRRRWDVLWVVTALAVLLMAQSRTTWIAAIAVVCVEAYRSSGGGATRSTRAGTIHLAAAAVSLLLAYLWSNVGGALEVPVGTSLGTVRARTDVWELTLELWRANPLLGYGPGLWGPEMRLALLGRLGWAPPHAHNQLLHTLGETGLVGAVALGAYLLRLTVESLRSATQSGGLTLALLVLLLFRSLTEVPLRLMFSDGGFLIHYMTVALVVAYRSAAPTPDEGHSLGREVTGNV